MNIQAALQKIEQAEKLLAEAKELLLSQSVAPVENHATAPAIEEPPQHDTPEGQIANLLRLALQSLDAEQAQKALGLLLHSELGDLAIAQLVRFNWSRLQRQVTDYLQNPEDPSSFIIMRTQEKKFAEGTEQKIFIQAKGRNPTPVAMRPDPKYNGKWRIYSFSL